ncbi:MAG TPA: alpha/beta hydrolase [Terriglobales bacterium]|nr:alpha/beta hydrolase [Terriglobales bacterium]
MPLDPQAEAILRLFKDMGFRGFAALGVEQARALFGEVERPPGESVAVIEDRSVPGPDGDIPVRLYRPDVSPAPPLVLYFHGGGWTIGSIEGHDPVCRALANRTGSAVLSVEYRLGPEHRFPAAIDDAWAATTWAASHAADLGADPERLAVAGDSAGGNLAAVVALQARDAGGPRIAFQYLIYPATDMRTLDWPSYRENGEGYFLELRDMEWFSGHYLSSQADAQDWRVSPAGAASHAGLPPALIQTAEYDPLRDQGEAYGELLRAAGVPVRVTRYPGMIHGFLSLEGMNAAQTALDEAGSELRAALGLEEAAPA